MSRIIEEFSKKSNFYSEKGASVEMITKAEEALGLRFANDYKEYLQQELSFPNQREPPARQQESFS